MDLLTFSCLKHFEPDEVQVVEQFCQVWFISLHLSFII